MLGLIIIAYLDTDSVYPIQHQKWLFHSRWHFWTPALRKIYNPSRMCILEELLSLFVRGRMSRLRKARCGPNRNILHMILVLEGYSRYLQIRSFQIRCKEISIPSIHLGSSGRMCTYTPGSRHTACLLEA